MILLLFSFFVAASSVHDSISGGFHAITKLT
jgi:hypothetical protein